MSAGAIHAGIVAGVLGFLGWQIISISMATRRYRKNAAKRQEMFQRAMQAMRDGDGALFQHYERQYNRVNDEIWRQLTDAR
jgi:hypothetical protein